MIARRLVDDPVELRQLGGTKDSLILEKLGGGGCQGPDVLTFQTHGGCVGLVLRGVVEGGEKEMQERRRGRKRCE